MTSTGILPNLPHVDMKDGPGNDNGNYRKTPLCEIKLSVNKVIGTTATNQSSISVVKNIVAFTAGAGVVTAELNGDQLVNQRFFCASTRLVQSIQTAQARHRSFDEIRTSGYQTDSYGFPISSTNESIVVLNNPGSSNGSLNNISDDISGLGLSPAKTNSSAKDKMKTTSCTALSYDGKLLAVGEVGHQPRIFIYSLAEDSNTKPLAIISEHRFGINFLSFSPCGRFLASLGTSNDGFLHIWRISLKENHVSLHSSNRCISTIKQLQWINSQVLLTVGIRHVRLWKVDDSDKSSIVRKPIAVLPGKNVILGQFSASSFTTIVAIDENNAILATQKGEIVVVRYSDIENTSTGTSIGTSSIESLLVLSFPVSAMTYDIETKKIWISGDKIVSISLNSLLNGSKSIDSEFDFGPIKGIYSTNHGNLIVLKNDKELIHLNSHDGTPVSLTTGHLNNLNGIRSTSSGILTWTTDGILAVWTFPDCQNIMTKIIPLSNRAELTAAHIDGTPECIFTGDSHGDFQIFAKEDIDRSLIFKFQAHIGRITDFDFAMRDDIQLLATCSRDRTIQIFTRKPREPWQLFQTLQDTHKGNIQRIRFGLKGERLISCSNDRTVKFHRLLFKESESDLVGYIAQRAISLKSTATDLMIDEINEEFVILADRQVSTYKLSTGESVRSYRLYDEDNVAITAACLGSIDGIAFLAAMGADKCLRIYDCAIGQMLASEYGHSVGISGIIFIQKDSRCGLVTSGQDGCMFLWDLSKQIVGQDESITGVSSPTRSSPTRKIISKTELNKFMSPTGTSSNPGSPRSRSRDRSPGSRDRSPVRSPMMTVGGGVGGIAGSAAGTATSRRSLAGPQMVGNQVMGSGTSAGSQMTGSPTSTPSRSSILRKGRLSPVRNSTEDLDIDRLIQQLQQFRIKYSADYTGTEKQKINIDNLRKEMYKTLETMGNGESRRDSEPNLESLVEKFGQQMIDMVEKRLNGVT